MGRPAALLVLCVCWGQCVLLSVSQLLSPSVSLASVRRRTGCIKVNQCKCILWDGSGLIDLQSLGDAQGFLERTRHVPHEDPPQDTEVLLSFSPCLPFSEPEEFPVTDCTDVAACLILRSKTHTNRYVNYGRHEGNKFHYNESTKTLSVFYLASSSHSEAQTVVHYHCSTNRSISYSLSFSLAPPLQIRVESPCCCPNACTLLDVGPGTIFLIILCLSITAYFILGSCALRPFRSSSGVQIVPEDSVWCMPCYQLTDRPSGTKRRRHCSLREETL
ncbi:uncharacterized protein LOC111192733 [Astyanax mexicanus]|uniref:Uncharacterized protein n=1 Tax=Astyanax mexicanus TaxID=7994 RepID=A0A8T2LM92_ASTMX|nr:uncharacterized protein LOC111192733 [Astyanax mexicanus]KAG9269971.1 hypothetical protein AMEX_G14877 [Astyanax mexicanus]